MCWKIDMITNERMNERRMNGEEGSCERKQRECLFHKVRKARKERYNELNDTANMKEGARHGVDYSISITIMLKLTGSEQ
jgi:hypothetical protein